MSDVLIETVPLGGGQLSRLVQAGELPDGWMARRPRGADEWRSRAQSRMAEVEWSARLRALLPAMDARGAALAQLERVIREGGVVVTTGQQPGLFGGPAYTFSKAIAALALAHALERATGIPTAAVYWAATDDADFAEAASTVIARPGGVEVLRSEHAPPPGTPMALAPLGDVRREIAALLRAAGSGADERIAALATAAYADASATVGSAFVTLMRGVLEPLGMPVLDASHRCVAEASAPLLARALHEGASVEAALAKRAADIRVLGAEPQVDDVAGLTLVFERDGTVKRRVPLSNAPSVRGTLTPNVLLRPVVEHEIMPTVAYVGGPGELAYFAQVGAVAAALGRPLPLAVPRWGCRLVEPATRELLSRFGVTAADLADPHALEGTVAVQAMSERSAAALREARRAVAALPAELAAEAEPLGLGPAMSGAMQSLQHRVDRMERRLVAGIKRRETALLRDVATLRGALRPLGKEQERALNLLPTLARHGGGLLEEMLEAARPHAAELVS